MHQMTWPMVAEALLDFQQRRVTFEVRPTAHQAPGVWPVLATNGRLVASPTPDFGPKLEDDTIVLIAHGPDGRTAGVLFLQESLFASAVRLAPDVLDIAYKDGVAIRVQAHPDDA